MTQVDVVEIFSGTECISNAFRDKGYKCFTLDVVEEFKPTLCKSILEVEDNELPDCSVMWASPPCQTFSVASISTHWDGGFRAYKPKTPKAIKGLEMLEKTIKIISIKQPKVWFIENPRGLMRKVIDELFEKYKIEGVIRHTVTYCQYGDTRMKPTDIWTNCKSWKPRPMCKNGAPCHEAAPRGSRTGTQGLKNSKYRSMIPKELCEEIALAAQVELMYLDYMEDWR